MIKCAICCVCGVFFDIMTIHNDHPSYVKHILGSIDVFFTLFGYCMFVCVGGCLPRGRYTTC